VAEIGTDTGPSLGLIAEIHVRVTPEELEALRRIGARKQASPGTVVRAMVRHWLIKWERGEEVTTELGAISWGARG
jgi:hypothetical protein